MVLVLISSVSIGLQLVNYMGAEESTNRIVNVVKEGNKGIRDVIWFDRQRQNENKSFAKVDAKFPAQYEVWLGDTLLERWHWYVEDEPKTYQFGKFITRNVINFNEAGEPTGWTTHRMDTYPTGNSHIFKAAPKSNSLALEFNHKDSTFSLWTLDNDGSREGAKITWVKGKVESLDKIHSNFVYATTSTEETYQGDMIGYFMSLVTKDSEAYIENMSHTYPFLNDLGVTLAKNLN